MKEKTDRRVKYTKALLKDALVELLKSVIFLRYQSPLCVKWRMLTAQHLLRTLYRPI